MALVAGAGAGTGAGAGAGGGATAGAGAGEGDNSPNKEFAKGPNCCRMVESSCCPNCVKYN